MLRIRNEEFAFLRSLPVTVPLFGQNQRISCSFETNLMDSIPILPIATYEVEHKIPALLLKAGKSAVSIKAHTLELQIEKSKGILKFSAEELSTKTHHKGYKRNTVGPIVSLRI
jgi:hypothetical protein